MAVQLGYDRGAKPSNAERRRRGGLKPAKNLVSVQSARAIVAHRAHTVGTLHVVEAGWGRVTNVPERLVVLSVCGGGAVIAGDLRHIWEGQESNECRAYTKSATSQNPA